MSRIFAKQVSPSGWIACYSNSHAQLVTIGRFTSKADALVYVHAENKRLFRG